MPDIQTISTIIGAIGGLLGFYSFIDAYLFRFRPSIQIANIIYLTFDNSKKAYIAGKLDLKSIICKLEVFNSRNKIGRFDDLMIRIYQTNELNATTYNFFPHFELSNIPNNCAGISSCSKSPFTPLTILPRSNRELTLEFTAEKNYYYGLAPKAGLCLEILYKNHKGNWIKIGKFTPSSYIEEPEDIGQDKIYQLSFVEFRIERDRLQNKKIKKTLNIYTGVAEYYLGFWIKKPYYYLKNFFHNIALAGLLVIQWLFASLRQIYYEIIFNTIMKGRGIKLLKWSSSTGNKAKSDITDQTLIKMKKILETKISELNKLAEKDAAIMTSDAERGFKLQRNKSQIYIYKSGDGSIIVQHSSDFNGNGSIIFSIQLTDYVFDIKLWRVNNREILFVQAICNKILDYFLYHSNYR